MTLSDWAAAASILSSAAVALSLVYLGLQIRQNTRHARAAINQGRIGRISDQQIALADPEIIAAWIVGNGGEPTKEAIRAAQFRRLVAAHFYGWQDSYFQHRHGLLDDDLFRQMRTAVKRALQEQPGFRREWANVRGFVDEILAEIDAKGGAAG